MNAKETLNKIAEALGVISEKPEVIETEVVETVEAQPEATEEAPKEVETVEEVSDEAVESTEAVSEESDLEKDETENVEKKEESAMENVEETVEAPNELEDLKKQIESLKELLKNTIEEEAKTVNVEIPEPKGLTHSPEKPVSTKARGIGSKGENIQSRVFKYINNN